MADDKSKDDELAGTEQPFVQHLFELRDRLIKAMAAIAVATVVLALGANPRVHIVFCTQKASSSGNLHGSFSRKIPLVPG